MLLRWFVVILQKMQPGDQNRKKKDFMKYQEVRQ